MDRGRRVCDIRESRECTAFGEDCVLFKVGGLYALPVMITRVFVVGAVPSKSKPRLRGS